MSDEKKIIIDEDWKSQVASEKETLAQEPQEAEPPAANQMPPASFEMLLTTFATEAMVALGQLPNPVTRETIYSPEHAKYAIDMLQMLEEKTKGNLGEDEQAMITDLLHQLRMLYVTSQTPPAAEEKNGPSIQD
ncbi:MAG: DUF1844 domain-containing protein [Planctomycetes bacterium]|nr:DUF1844 domain-containing protein [Planctomycetota bacterium]